MTPELATPPAAGPLPRLGEDLVVDDHPALAARIQGILSGYRLPAFHSWHEEEGWGPIVADELLRDESFSSRRVGFVRPARGVAEAIELLRPLEAVEDALGWRAAGSDLFERSRDRDEPFQGRDDQFLFVSSRKEGKGAEGMTWGSRGMEVDVAEGGRLTLTYTVKIELVYVLPSARGKNVGRILATAVAYMVGRDLDALEKASDQGEGMDVRIELSAEAESTGGMALLDAIADDMEASSAERFESVSFERDYDL